MADFASATVKFVDGMQFVGETGTGHAFVMDAAPGVGGKNTGCRPMELLLVGLGGCTGMDVVSILRKKKLNVKIGDIVIYVEDEKGNVVIKKGQLKPI